MNSVQRGTPPVVRKVYDDGRHNAFTALCEWRGRLYLAFRNGERHVSPDGRIVVMVSADQGASWSRVGEYAGPPGDDMRDPKWAASPARLDLHAFAFHERRRKDAFVASSEDGRTFTPFVRALVEDDVVIWWPVHHQGRFYAAGYRYSATKAEIRSVFLQSAGGLQWSVVSVIHDVPWSNETALVLEPDGTATAFVRNESSDKLPVIARAKPPYVEWRPTTVPEVLQGLAVHRLPDRYLVAARVYDPEGRRTAVFTYREGLLQRRFTLPSGGDTSYAGFVQDGERILMSYYSSHEHAIEPPGSGPAAIYLAEFGLDALSGSMGGSMGEAHT